MAGNYFLLDETKDHETKEEEKCGEMKHGKKATTASSLAAQNASELPEKDSYIKKQDKDGGDALAKGEGKNKEEEKE